MFDCVDELAALARPEGPWVVIDGYHAFMAIDSDPFSETTARSAFFLGGGYKYAMAGEGMGFMHCPPGFGPRPPITGWFAEFGDLTAPPGSWSATPGTRCASWARPSILRRCTASTPSSGCWREKA